MEVLIVYLVLGIIACLCVYIFLVIRLNTRLADDVNHCYEDQRNGFDKKSIHYLASIMETNGQKHRAREHKKTAIKKFMKTYDAYHAKHPLPANQTRTAPRQVKRTAGLSH